MLLLVYKALYLFLGKSYLVGQDNLMAVKRIGGPGSNLNRIRKSKPRKKGEKEAYGSGATRPYVYANKRNIYAYTTS